MIELADYREISGQYDHVVSIGMFEHVGEKFWPEYLTNVHQRLKPGGKAMIQSITLDEKVFNETYGKPGFMETYIFPGGMLPSPSRFREEVEKAGLVCCEVFTFGQDYKRTLEHWLARFEAKSDAIRALGRDEYFIRLWRFYLAGCIAAFTTGRTSVMQAEIMHASAHNPPKSNNVYYLKAGA
jgi:cyclopropane-fatty-acyl-phospholipid synthase